MSNRLDRLVARIGNSSQVPALILGEMGYDVDVKTFRVGDDTATPPRIMTDKSVGAFSFKDVSEVGFNKILLLNKESTVDGVTPSLLNKTNGLLVRVGDNKFESRSFDTDEYIAVDNADGVGGNPTIRIRDSLFDALRSNQGIVSFSWGEEPPVLPPDGSFFWSTIDFLLYVWIPSGEFETVPDGETDDGEPRFKEIKVGAWVDIASASGSGGGATGNRTYSGEEPPAQCYLGDLFIDTSDNYRVYMRLQDDSGLHWREVFTTI